MDSITELQEFFSNYEHTFDVDIFDKIFLFLAYFEGET
jgi:hypothetical protein